MSYKLECPEESSLISLSVRFSESSRKKSRIEGGNYASSVEKLSLDYRKYDDFFVHETMTASSMLIERSVKNYIEENPGAAVINLGCGYDDLFSRVDNGNIFWYDVDLPSVMEKRRNFFSSGERFMELEGSALDSSWTVFVNKERKPLVVSEGLSLHFSERHLKKLLEILYISFPSGHFISDFWSPWAMSKLSRKFPVKDARWGRGFESAEEILKMNGAFSLEKEVAFSSVMQDFPFRSKANCRRRNSKDGRVCLLKW